MLVATTFPSTFIFQVIELPRSRLRGICGREPGRALSESPTIRTKRATSHNPTLR